MSLIKSRLAIIVILFIVFCTTLFIMGWRIEIIDNGAINLIGPTRLISLTENEVSQIPECQYKKPDQSPMIFDTREEMIFDTREELDAYVKNTESCADAKIRYLKNRDR